MKRHVLLLLLCLTAVLPSAWSQGTVKTTVNPAVLPATPTYADAVTAVAAGNTSSGIYGTGTVTFSVDGGAGKTVTIVNAKALVNLGQLAIGTHTLTSQYSGDAQYAPATESVTFTVSDLSFVPTGTQSGTFFKTGSFTSPAAVVVDSLNNIYVADSTANRIQKLDVFGNITTLATTGLNNPTALNIDATNNIYISDTGNSRVVMLTPAGVQTTLTIPGLGHPGALAYDNYFHILFVADPDNNRILADTVYLNQAVTLVSGLTGIRGIALTPDAPATSTFSIYYADKTAGFNRIDVTYPGQIAYSAPTPIFANLGEPATLTVDRNSNLYLADRTFNTVLLVDPNGHQIALNNSADTINALTADKDGRLLVALGTRIDALAPALTHNLSARAPDTLVGAASVFQQFFAIPQGQTSFTETGAPATTFNTFGAALCPNSARNGQCSVAVTFSPKLAGSRTGTFSAKPSTGSTLSGLLFGTGFGPQPAYLPAPASQTPTTATVTAGVALGADGAFYASDSTNNKVYKTLAGATTTLPFTGLSYPGTVQVDAAGSVYVLDRLNYRIVKLDTAGNQTVPVQQSFAGPFTDIYTFTLDPAGRLFVSGESYEPGDAQRRTTSGIYICDSQGGCTFFNQGDANQQQSVAVDPYGLVYTLSYSGTLIRYDQNGTILNSYTAQGFSAPATLVVDAGQNVYITSPFNETLYVVPANSLNKLMPLPLKGVLKPTAIAIDGLGDLLIGDSSTNQYTYLDRSQALYAFGTDSTMTPSTLPGMVSNIGNQPVTLLTLPGNANFVQAATQSGFAACATATLLAQGGACDLSYTFTPATPTAYSYTGAITSSTGAAVANFTGSGVPTPALTLSPATIEISAPMNQTVTSNVINVKNTGLVAITNFRGAISGAGAAPFTYQDGCGTQTLNPGDSCYFYMTLNSATAGQFAATITLTATPSAGGPDVSGSTALMGFVSGPSFVVTPPTTDFGTTILNQTTSRYITITNTGTAFLPISNVTLGGDSAFLSISSSTGCYAQVGPGESCSYVVNFTPLTVGSHSATFTVNPQNLPSQTVTITDNGVAAVPQAVVTPKVLAFGNIPINTASAPQTLTVTNTGNADLVFTYNLQGSIFAQTATTCNQVNHTLVAGASCTYTFTAMPFTAAPFTLSFSISGNEGDPSTGMATFTGTGVAANAPQAALTPATANFGSVTIGQSAMQVFTLTNAGTGALPITGATTGSAAFPIASSTCGASLAAGASCTYTVNFTPTATGAQTATLSVTDSVGTQTSALTGTGAAAPAPQAALTPATANFGSVTLGQSATQTLTLTNAGNAALPITAATIAGTQYTTTGNTCGTSLAAGAACTYTITFTPAATGAQTATFSVTDAVGTQSSALTGTGVAAAAPQAALTPATANFGSVTLGQSANLTFTLSNAGTAALPITGAAIAGAQYTIAGTTCGTSLAAGGACTYTVTFTPTAAATANATLSVTDSVGTQTSALTGTGVAAAAPQAALTPATANFGSVTLGQSSTQTVTLTNAGTAALPITSSSLASVTFTITAKTCTTTLAAGASCTFTITYTPTVAGTQTAVFSVVDSVGTQSSNLIGTGVAAATPQAALTPATASFGNVAANTTSPAQLFTLTNAGTAALPITSATLTGAGFTLGANTCSTSLAAGATCTLSVTFSPTAAAAYTATLTVVDSVGTQTSTLTGTGTISTPPDFTITPTPAAQASYRGQSVSYNVALASLVGANPFTGPVVLTATGLPAGATATFTPATVVPGGSTTFTVAIPALSGANSTPNTIAQRTGIAFATLIFGLVLTRRRRIAPKLLLFALALVAASTVSGCGTGTGFAIPSTTSVITITGTSGATVHSTTVTLTVK